MLSQTAEHAIRALLYLAGEAADRAASVDEVAKAIGAPRNYLAKTLNALARTDIVTASRGPGGGYRLDLAPAAVPVSRIMDEFDPPAARVMCLLGGRPCDADHPCAAHDRWIAMWDLSREPLRSTTLADLLGDRAFAAGMGGPDSRAPVQLAGAGRRQSDRSDTSYGAKQ